MSGPIILDISYGNLYSSYEEFHKSEINDFETPDVKFIIKNKQILGIKS